MPARPDAPEGEGYLLNVANDFSAMRSELVIADAMRLEQGPVARVKLPFRLHTQVHGWWEPAPATPATAAGGGNPPPGG